MPVTTEQMYVVFQSIDASLKALVTHFGALRVPINGNVPPSPPAYTVPRIASDAELDGPRGNPLIRAKSPRDWTGDDYLGQHFSDCPPAYLDLLAERYDYFNESEEDAKKRRYNENDASRARGWAQRKRNGWVAPAQEPAGFPSDGDMAQDVGRALTDDEILF